MGWATKASIQARCKCEVAKKKQRRRKGSAALQACLGCWSSRALGHQSGWSKGTVEDWAQVIAGDRPPGGMGCKPGSAVEQAGTPALSHIHEDTLRLGLERPAARALATLGRLPLGAHPHHAREGHAQLQQLGRALRPAPRTGAGAEPRLRLERAVRRAGRR